MAFQKFSDTATTKTHGAVDASMIDVLMPHTELVGSTSNLMRSAAYGVIGWVGRGYRDTKSFGF